MAEQRQHLRYTKAPEGSAEYRYSPRGSEKDEKKDETPNYELKSQSFRTSLDNYTQERDRREAEKNKSLNIPANIVCLEFQFHDWFDSSKYEVRYRQDFGLAVISYFDFNRQALFAIVDDELFLRFIDEIIRFINCVDHSAPTYNRNVIFIQEFKFHTTEDILSRFRGDDSMTNFKLVESLELDVLTGRLLIALQSYLNSKGISYIYNAKSNEIEIASINSDTALEIARNFDIVQTVNSYNYVITRPSKYGTQIREYPFIIRETPSNLPVFGIVDTGVSDETPLSVVLLNTDNAFALNGMNPRVDEAYDGDGHGTAVAAFVVLGEQLSNNIKAELEADAQVLSIKVLSDTHGKIANSSIIRLIEKANDELGVKFFTLTICYSNSLEVNSPPSDYAYLLDLLAYERDLLIFICTANNNENIDNIDRDYPDHFLKSENNICAPSESMNNITVGALGDNLEPEQPILKNSYPISSSVHPAFYTRKFHLDYTAQTKKNGMLRKPDVIFAGGNLMIQRDQYGLFPDSYTEAALKYMSANKAEPILRGFGTSFATPLVANLAAKILKRFPDLNPQTVKALIINSTEKIRWGGDFNKFKKYHKDYIAGFGKPNPDRCIYSYDNEPTVLIEATILLGTVLTMPIKIPDYLNEAQKNKKLLAVDATICYRFKPLNNQHLAYCPINISFGLFKDVQLEVSVPYTDINGKSKTRKQGIAGGSAEDIGIGHSWSQDAYNKSKLLSNVQKISFNVSRDTIAQENNTLKIAVRCHAHKNLPEHIINSLPTEYEFSLVLRFRDNQTEDRLEDRFYSDFQQINELEVLTDITLQGDLDIRLDG